MKILIDAGHGIDTPGKRSPDGSFREYLWNREIADLLIAVNRSYNKSDYIPCIAWGRNARFAKNLAVGEKIAISGRIQSRIYTKMIEGESFEKTAYEVSIIEMNQLT